jgi:glycosyltransferase involved in cell wall biosynthesis
MRKILLVSTAYPPPSIGGAARTAKLLRWLPKFGWEPVLLTISRVPLPEGAQRLDDDPDFVHRVECMPWRYRKSRAQNGGRTAGASTAMRRSNRLRPTARRLYSNLFEFPDPVRSWITPAVRLGRALAQNQAFDLIYSSSGLGVSGHFVAARLQEFLKIPWVHEYRDLWAKNPWRPDKPYWWRDWLDLFFERRFLRQSAGVVLMHQRIADLLRARQPNLPPERVHIAQNGFDDSEFVGQTESPTSPPLRLCYTGVLYGGKRDLSGLFVAIRRLVDSKEIEAGAVEFVYAGPDGAVVRDAASRVSLGECVRDRGRVPAAEAKRLQLEAHVLVLVEAADDNPWVRGNVPGKAYEYLGAKRPVLALANTQSSIAELYAGTRAGVTFAPNDSEGIAGYLAAAFRMLVSTGSLPYEPDAEAVRSCNWESIAQALCRFLSAVHERSLQFRYSR